MSTKIILLFSLALDETHAVFNKSFATMLHAIGAHTGSDIFHFVVFLTEGLKKSFKMIGISASIEVLIWIANF